METNIFVHQINVKTQNDDSSSDIIMNYFDFVTVRDHVMPERREFVKILHVKGNVVRDGSEILMADVPYVRILIMSKDLNIM